MTGKHLSADVVTVEVGSTITKVNAFALDGGAFVPVGQGFAPTSVAEGDVGLGVAAAREDLRRRHEVDLTGVPTHVNSSAAGGLRMSVHGLTSSMTARAAREASLGAGAIVGQVTVGRLTEDDLASLTELAPNIVLLAGGVDHGERDIVIGNALALADTLGRLPAPPPVLYAGNVAARPGVERAFGEKGVRLLLADNVFPEVDVLVVDPLRVLIHDVFSEHIIHAPGMTALAGLTEAEVLPTPGAVLLAAELFARAAGDVLVVDVGGATTDVHSVTDGSPDLAASYTDPEPRAKRTVEGDLGVFVNAREVARASGEAGWDRRLEHLRAVPDSQEQQDVTRWLAERAVEIGVRRHAGTIADVYTPSGKRQVVRGKDLTAVRWVVATGGALTRIPGAAQALSRLCTGPGRHLLPAPDARILIDDGYRFSALGTLARSHPDEVTETLRRWVESTA